MTIKCTSGNNVKAILGTDDIIWDVNKKQGAYEGHAIYDHNLNRNVNHNSSRNNQSWSTKNNKRITYETDLGGSSNRHGRRSKALYENGSAEEAASRQPKKPVSSHSKDASPRKHSSSSSSSSPVSKMTDQEIRQILENEAASMLRKKYNEHVRADEPLDYHDNENIANLGRKIPNDYNEESVVSHPNRQPKNENSYDHIDYLNDKKRLEELLAQDADDVSEYNHYNSNPRKDSSCHSNEQLALPPISRGSRQGGSFSLAGGLVGRDRNNVTTTTTTTTTTTPTAWEQAEYHRLQYEKFKAQAERESNSSSSNGWKNRNKGNIITHCGYDDNNPSHSKNTNCSSPSKRGRSFGGGHSTFSLSHSNETDLKIDYSTTNDRYTKPTSHNSPWNHSSGSNPNTYASATTSRGKGEVIAAHAIESTRPW